LLEIVKSKVGQNDNMEINPLHFEFRIEAITLIKGQVRNAKVFYVKQKGELEEGWGLANKKGPKIYILSFNKEVIYVGITKQPLLTRFRQGLTATGENGYHGYRWKELANKGKSKPISLFVYKFDNEERTEAIEAEVAYLIRDKTNKWPKYQTEIHFHQANKEEILIAKQIYDQVFAESK
jgi:hypothetical protein